MDNKKIPHLAINIKNQTADEVIIDIDGVVGMDEEGSDNTLGSIKNKLEQISNIDASTIVVNINSSGGFVNQGLAIHDVLAQHKAKVVTKVTGFTASAATIIAQAGDIREMSENGLYLVHKSWGFAIGNVNALEKAIDAYKKVDDRIANIYAKRSNQSVDSVRALMNENEGDGKWLDSKEALEYGLIDSVFEPMKLAASVDLSAMNEVLPSIPKPKADSIELSEDKEEGVEDFVQKEVDEIKSECKKTNQVQIKENDSQESGPEVREGQRLHRRKAKRLKNKIINQEK